MSLLSLSAPQKKKKKNIAHLQTSKYESVAHPKDGTKLCYSGRTARPSALPCYDTAKMRPKTTSLRFSLPVMVQHLLSQISLQKRASERPH